MVTITRILAPTDLSEHSKDGVRAALDLARAHGARVTIYDVIELDGVSPHGSTPHPEESALAHLIDERKKVLANFVQENFAGMITVVEVLQDVEAGMPNRKILDRAVEESTDVIVLSTHGRAGLLNGLIGSVAEMIVRLAPCPVLSVHPAMRKHIVKIKGA
jgi:nucleotide-binding universal stress UspA family protein